MHENIDRILFTEDEIKQRVAEIGAGITQDYKDDPDGVILISVLRGARWTTWPSRPTATA